MHAKRTGVVLAVTALVLVGSVGPAAASHQPSFVVALDEGGDATVTVTYTYDLDDDAEQAAFEELRNNETAVAAFEDRARERFAAVAAASENRTGREMAIESATLELTREDQTGVVEVTVQWIGLAATTEDGLVLDEPFASGFEPDRQFVVVLPDGYEATDVTPSAGDSTDGRLTWAGDASLNDFEVVAQTAASGTTDADTAEDTAPGTTAGDGPGFGLAGALVALLVASVLALRRH